MQTTKSKSYLTIIIIASVAAAAGIAALFLVPSLIPFPESKELYVIYYGNLHRNGVITDEVAQIIAAKPAMAIIPYMSPDGQLNLTPEIHEQFSDAGIQVITYTWTNYGNRDINEVLSEIDAQMAAGVDGIFVDEVTNIVSNAEYNYYSQIYRHAKSYGEDKMVIMNPGHYKVTERVMSITDIVSLEEEWVYHNDIPWKTKYAPARFMGVSSNEYCGSCISNDNALQKTFEAWGSGIGYHFATNVYIELPDWFGSYAQAVSEEKEKEEKEG